MALTENAKNLRQAADGTTSFLADDEVFGANDMPVTIIELLQDIDTFIMRLFEDLLKDPGYSPEQANETATTFAHRAKDRLVDGIETNPGEYGAILGGNTEDLHDIIAKGESGGNYNIAYGGIEANFTDMTIGQVLDWQRDYVADGSASSAVGKFQFIRPTLEGLVDEVEGIDKDTVFSPDVQDRLADQLLARRGYDDFLEGKISETEFMENLSKEWASLPKDMSGQSYYAGDGLNAAHIAPDEMVRTLRYIKENGPEEQPTQTASLDQQATADTSFSGQFRRAHEGVRPEEPGNTSGPTIHEPDNSPAPPALG